MEGKILKTIFCFLICLFFASSIFAVILPLPQHTEQSLEFVMQQTLKQNPNVLESIAKEQIAESALKEARGDFFPSVDLRVAHGSEESMNVDTDENNITLPRTETGFVVTQPIFTGLKTYNLVKQKRSEIKSALFNERYIRNDVALQAVNAYLNILRIDQLQKLTLANVATHNRYLSMVKLKYHGGAGRVTDVHLAAARLAESSVTLESINGYLQIAKEVFVKVTGLQAKILFLPKNPGIPSSLSGVKNVALQYNPALQIMGANLQTAESSISVAKSALAPTVNLEFAGNDNRNVGGVKGKDKDIRGMVVLDYNIFRGNSDRERINQAVYNKFAVMHQMDSIRREVVAAAASAWDKYLADEAKIADIKAHVSDTEKTLDGYKELFALGRVSLLNVLDMENELFNAKANLINAQYSILSDRYQILSVMGYLVDRFNT